MVVFAQPWLLAGLAAIGLPILIHYLTRPRPRRIELPTWHMLVDAGGGMQAMHRLRTWVILALRTLAVAAIVLLFARPLWTAAEAARDPGAPRRVVLIVDASLSMQAGEGGVRLFDKAKAEAADLLRGLESGSEAAVIFAGAEPKAALPALSRNIPALHESLSLAEPTQQRADPAAALALAGRMLESAGEVFVFSDFQKSNWSGAPLSAGDGVKLRLRPVAERAVENLGLTALSLSPAEPIEGESVELRATVFNATPHRRRATLSLDLEGVSQKTELELQPYSDAEASFTFSLPGVTEAGGSVSIEPDALAADNARHFVVRVRKALKVLLICDADKTDSGTGAFFVERAMSPTAESRTGMSIVRRLSQEVDRGALETADAFVLAPPTRASGETIEIIARRVGEGAPLIVLLDGPTARDTVNALAGASKGTIRPPFEFVRELVSDDARGVGLRGPSVRGGPLAVFDAADAGDLSTVRVTRRFGTDIDPARERDVLLRYEDDTAAVSMAQAGRGAVVFANLPIEPAVSTAPGSPLFPVLLHELMRELRRGDAAAENRPGRPWFVDVSEPTPPAAEAAQGVYSVAGPGEAALEATAISRGRSTRLAVAPAAAAGLYRVMNTQRSVGLAVVNTDAAETDTRPMNLTEALAAADSAAGVSIVDDRGDLAAAGRPRPWWPYLAAIAALALALEMLLLALWRRRPAPAASHRALAPAEAAP